MSEELINNWSQYINETDLKNLNEFVESVLFKREFQDGRKVLCIKGKGNTGKTTLVKEIMKLVGNRTKQISAFDENLDTRNCDLVVIQEFSKEEEQTIAAIIKKMTSKDDFVQKELYSDTVIYQNTAKLIFVTDRDSEFDEATKNRIVTINLTHVFSSNNTYTYTYTPKYIDIVEALQNLKIEGTINTGKAAYGKIIHSDEKYNFCLLAHASIRDKKIQITFMVRQFLNDQKEDEPHWHDQVYYDSVFLNCSLIPNNLTNLSIYK